MQRDQPDAFLDEVLQVLLDEAEKSGEYIEVNGDEFDVMEREALALARG